MIGLGNPLRGDDGVGPAVLAALRPAVARRPDVTLVESAGHDLAEWLGSGAFGRIIVVDAADLGGRPGVWMRLTSDRLTLSSATALSHGMGLVESLGLLAALEVRPAPLDIYAVQPAAVGWRPGLSLEVRQAVVSVAAAIRRDLALPKPPRRARTVRRDNQEVRSLPRDGKAA